MAGIQRIRAARPGEDDYGEKVSAYQATRAKGAGYWVALRERLATPEADADKSGGWAARYVTTVERGVETPGNVSHFTGTADRYSTRARGAPTDAYVNYMDPASGRIIASYNYAEQDIDTEENAGTRRIPNSEVLWQQYLLSVRDGHGEETAPEQVREVAPLTEVVRSSIQNEHTQLILDLILRVVDRHGEKTFDPGTDEFNALLGSDNCKGVAFMLKDHASALRQTITGITVRGSNYIRVRIGPYEG